MNDIIQKLNPNKTASIRELGKVDITELKQEVQKSSS